MAKRKQALVSVTNDLYTDQRVHKVCLFLEELGYSVLLIGRLKKDSQPLSKRTYRTKRMKLIFKKGAKFYVEYNIRLFINLLFHRTDLLVSNDLDTLLANYTASKFKPNSKLVYDTHEYFTEVPELIDRPKIKRFWEGIEAWIFPKLKTVYTVNESIAKLYEDKYKRKVEVVRNISPLWEASGIKTKKDLGIPEGKKLIILQGAGINIHRGAEEAVEAMKQVDNTILMIVGDGDVLVQLKTYVKENNLQSRVLFFGKKPYNELMNYTHYADIGLTLDKPTNLNYCYSLPNKVFDYIHAETPIVATKLVEIENIINQYKVGVFVDPFDVNTLSQVLNSLLSNEEKHQELKMNCQIAKEALNWKNEIEVLKRIYTHID
jgi:glycosyltransferase involved in cell wall biosynthesis